MKMQILSKFHGTTLLIKAIREPFQVTPSSTLCKRITIANFHIVRDSFAHISKTFVLDLAKKIDH